MTASSLAAMFATMNRIAETALKTLAEILVVGAVLWFVAVPGFQWAARAGWFGSTVQPTKTSAEQSGAPR